jgi:hypothetical protein
MAAVAFGHFASRDAVSGPRLSGLDVKLVCSSLITSARIEVSQTLFR